MIKDLAELKKFLALCRKQGVHQITYGSVSVTFGDLPQRTAGEAEDDEPKTREPSDEELMFLSSDGVFPP